MFGGPFWKVDLVWVCYRVGEISLQHNFSIQKPIAHELHAEILHQLRLVVYPIIYRILYIPGGEISPDFFHQQYVTILFI